VRAAHAARQLATPLSPIDHHHFILVEHAPFAA
jgi:hypothetical protein